nr:hypothetical protein [Tanacetum cinerariifolium]
MVWIHPDAAIDDPRPATGSFSMADVRQLSAHVIKLREMSEGILVLSGLSRVWKSHVCDPILRVMGIHDFICLSEWTILEKQDASTSGATLGHVAKRTRYALVQSPSITTRPSLCVGDFDDESDGDGDDDACVKIMLVTLFRSIAVVPSSRNQGGSYAGPTAVGFNTRVTAKINVLHCMMMSQGGELPARYPSMVARLSTALNQATVLEAEKDEEILLLRATSLEFSSFF